MYVDKGHIQSLMEAKRTKISDLASQIQDLMRLREAEINELAALQAMISPVAKLPTELLAKIFHLVVPPEGFWDHDMDETNKVVDAAHRVSQVSRYWRQIAHGTPQLWVDGFRFHASEKATKLALEQTNAWLERSYPQPITIYFCCRRMDGLGTSFATTELFTTLLSTTQRWRHVIWDIHHLFPLCGLPPGSFEALERFSIESMDIRHPPEGLDIILAAPRLREVAICIRNDRGSQSDMLGLFRIPWNQLTHLTLEEDLSFEDCRDIMLQCTNARSIKIHASLWDESSLPLTPVVVVLPNMETLEFHQSYGLVGIAIGHLFACLALPALKSLELSVENLEEEPIITWDAGLFSQFQDRSPNIERISLRANEVPVHAENLIALLRHSPVVAEVTIDDCQIDDAFIRGLEVHQNDPQVLAPRLVNLHLAYSVRDGDVTPSDNALEAMIRSRWWPDASIPHRTSRLESVRIHRERAPNTHGHPGLQRNLAALREQGLKLSIY